MVGFRPLTGIIFWTRSNVVPIITDQFVSQFPSPYGVYFFEHGHRRYDKSATVKRKVSVPLRGLFFWTEKGMPIDDIIFCEFPSPYGAYFFGHLADEAGLYILDKPGGFRPLTGYIFLNYADVLNVFDKLGIHQFSVPLRGLFFWTRWAESRRFIFIGQQGFRPLTGPIFLNIQVVKLPRLFLKLLSFRPLTGSIFLNSCG